MGLYAWLNDCNSVKPLARSVNYIRSLIRGEKTKCNEQIGIRTDHVGLGLGKFGSCEGREETESFQREISVAVLFLGIYIRVDIVTSG